MSKSIATLFDQSILSNHVIESAIIDPDANGDSGRFIIGLTSGFQIFIEDAGQDCCESRYLHTSDDLSNLIGETLVSIRISEVEYRCDRGEDHEVAFLTVSTKRDAVVVETHNEHNGYYGGFSVHATVIDPSGRQVGKFNLDTD